MSKTRQRMAHLKADLAWAVVRVVIAWQKRVSLPRKELPTATPDRYARVHVLRGARVPMRDGVTLASDVYLPADEAVRAVNDALPAILIRMPYGIREPYAYMPAIGRHWARKGYACVVQDVRGKFGSEGVWDPFVHEVDDGYDAIEWVAQQSWCNGRVGMTGESYFAYTQWAAASSCHPALVCIAPGDMGVDAYALIYEGGALTLGSVALWACDQAWRTYVNWLRFDTRHLPLRDMARAAGLPSTLYDELIAHPTRDAFWRRYDLTAALETIAIPVFLWSGWYDNMLLGTLDCWHGMEVADASPRGVGGDADDALGSGECRRPRWLTLGPTDHETSPDFSGRVGRIDLPFGPRSWDRVQAFLDAHLRGEDEAGFAVAPRVRAYVTGADRWREADVWPLPGTIFARYYLSGPGGSATGGRLGSQPPAAEPPDIYAYDPLDPSAWWEGKDLWAAARHLGDRRPLEARPDVLVYTGEPLPAPLEVVGPIRAVIWVATSAPDTDVVVSLVDVFPDGCVQLVQQGIRRLRYRASLTHPELAEPGHVYRLDLDLAATGHLFAVDHRLRVEVASADFDRWDRNPNTGHAFGADAETRVAAQTVYHDAKRASHVVLPVIGEELPR